MPDPPKQTMLYMPTAMSSFPGPPKLYIFLKELLNCRKNSSLLHMAYSSKTIDFYCKAAENGARCLTTQVNCLCTYSVKIVSFVT